MNNYLDLINEAEELFLDNNKEEALEKYITVCEEADKEFLENHKYAYKRSIQLLDEFGSNPELAVKYMNLFESYFIPDENGEIYIEIADKEFLEKYRNKTYENLAEYYYISKEYGDEAIEYVLYTFEETVDPEFAYITGVYLEELAKDNVDLMIEYGVVICNAFTIYLAAIDPFDPDIERILHSHNVLDYYYGFGYGVERNIEISTIHENASKNIRRKTGRKKAEGLSELLAGINSVRGEL